MLILAALPAGIVVSAEAPAASAPVPVDVPTRITPFLASGFGIRWNTRIGKLVYNKLGENGYYDLVLLDPDGKNERPLTLNNPLLPGRHAGSPCWHPSGRYILFAAEKKEHPGSSAVALPGWGGFSDMWLITTDGKHAWKLVDEPLEAARGMLLPQFSPDGRKIAWCEAWPGPICLTR